MDKYVGLLGHLTKSLTYLHRQKFSFILKWCFKRCSTGSNNIDRSAVV